MKRVLEKMVGSYFGLSGVIGFIYLGILRRISMNNVGVGDSFSQGTPRIMDTGIIFAWILALVLWSNVKKKYLVIMLAVLITLVQGSSLFFCFRMEIFIWLSIQFFLLLLILYFEDSQQ